MERKLNYKLLLLYIVAVVLTLINSGFAEAKGKRDLFRQAKQEHVFFSAAKKKISPQELSQAIVVAEDRIKNLEMQMRDYTRVQGLGFWERWIKSINIYEVQENYARGVVAHLKAMTDVLKLRRLSGNEFTGLSEFHFNILFRQSDFVLNSFATKHSVQKISGGSSLAQRLEKALYQYNQERLFFDSKMVAWNE